MASKVLVVSVVLLFAIAVVGIIPKYGLRSENQDDVNCTEAQRFLHCGVCNSGYENDNYLSRVYPCITEDLYREINQQLTAFCASQCKSNLVANYKCYNLDTRIAFINDFTCGKINQEYCYIHYLRGVTAGTIVTYSTLWRICPKNRNTSIYYCTEGACQRNMTQYADYMGCCTGPPFGHGFNLTSCGIANTTVCSSGTVTISSSVFIMIAIAIIQMYWM